MKSQRQKTTHSSYKSKSLRSEIPHPDLRILTPTKYTFLTNPHASYCATVTHERVFTFASFDIPDLD
jgi:hypothetical protein